MEEDKYLTVKALTKYIKYKFDCDKHLDDILLCGEVSNFKHHARGHFYFTLKDEYAQIPCMMFQTYASKVLFKVEDGMKLYARGKVSVYEAGGYYQFSVVEIKKEGLGDLYLKYEALKKELSEAGLFDVSHKRAIKQIPKVIGVITSSTGAVIKDIINTTKRRYPLCTILLYPALVQGEMAKDSIVKAIKKANDDNLCDTLIVGRGGGSIEDLWPFNERDVAYAIYNSLIPVISAVGHETDFTIADFVADIRAATPTAAAEIATPNVVVLKENIKNNVRYLNQILNSYLDNIKRNLANIDIRFDNNNPYLKLKDKKKNVIELKNRLDYLVKNILSIKEREFILYSEKLKVLNPLNIMDKGYSISKDKDKILRSINDTKVGNDISITLKDGIVMAEVKEILKDGKRS